MSYLSTLHRQPAVHKKRFALFVSGTITLFIFGVWSLVNFGGDGGVIARKANMNTAEVSPLESFGTNVASSFSALKDSFVELKTTLNIYGE